MLQECDRWDARFFLLVDMIASWSEDTSRKVGCIVVGASNEIISTGYNGFPRGVSALSKERHAEEKGEKYSWFEHAERNAIYNAARNGVSIAGSRMYVNSFPCADCARAIIQSGVNELRTFDFDLNDRRFGRSFIVATEMFGEAGVRVLKFDRRDDLISRQESHFAHVRDPGSGLLR